MKKKVVWAVVRIAVTAGFVALLFKLVDVRAAVDQWRSGDPVWIAGMTAILVATIVDISIRWWLLLRASGIEARFTGVFNVTYAGYFFNTVLPGGAGGDIARAVLVAKDTDKKAAVVGTVLLDRLIGLGTLLVIGLATASLQWGRSEFRQPILALGVMVGAGAVGALVYLSPLINREWLRRKWPAIANVDEVLTLVKRRPMLMALGVLLSVAGQTLAIFAYYGLAQGLHFTGVTPAQCFALVPIYAVVNALPISFGGLGVGEAAAVYLFGLMAMAPEQAAALALLYRACVIAVSLPGGVIFALGKAKAA